MTQPSEAPVESGPIESAPSEGPASDLTSPLEHPWGRVSRCVALGSLLGLAVVVWVQLSYFAPWLPRFISHNTLQMERRMVLLGTMVGGGAVGALAAGGMVWWQHRRRAALEDVERWLWFLSPLLLLPALPILFEAKAWQNKHDRLLPAMLLTGMVAEVLLFRAFCHVPQQVSRALTLVAQDLQKLKKRVHPWIVANSTVLLIALACIGYGLFMSFYTIRWHHKLGTAIFDLGINNNLMHGGLEGVFNQSTVIFPQDPAKYVANHVKLGLYLFLPIYALVPRAETLLVIQSFALGLGALPLFLFARKRLPEWAAVVIAFCYLAYYPMHSANFYEMKEVPIASVFVLTTIWAADARRWVICAIAFFCALIMREDTPPGLAVIGGFLLLSGYRPRAGLIMAAIATSWFVFLRFYVMEEAGDWWFPNMYEGLWAPGEKGFGSVIKTLVSNPYFTLRHVLVEKKVFYLLHLLVPLMFLPARRWYLWAAFVPGAIITLLVTNYNPPIMFTFQYVMYWAPLLFVAAVLFLAEVAKRVDFGPQRARAALVAMAFASVVLSYNYGAFALREKSFRSGYHTISFTFTDAERKRYADLRELVQHLPPKASVAATERVGAHVSARVKFYSLRRGTHGAEYLIGRPKELRLDRTRSVLHQALRSKEYGVLHRVGEFVLFKKGHDASKNDELIAEWKLGGSRSIDKKPTEAPASSAEAQVAEQAEGDDGVDEDDSSPGEAENQQN